MEDNQKQPTEEFCIKDEILEDIRDTLFTNEHRAEIERLHDRLECTEEYYIAVLLVRLNMQFVQNRDTGKYIFKCKFDKSKTAKFLLHCLKISLQGKCDLNDTDVRPTTTRRHYELIINSKIDELMRYLGLINLRGGLIQGLPQSLMKLDFSTTQRLVQCAFLARGLSVRPDTPTRRLEISMPTLPVSLAFIPLLESVGITGSVRDSKDNFRVIISGQENVQKFLKIIKAHKFADAWESQQNVNSNRALANRNANFDLANITKSSEAAMISYQQTKEAFEILDESEMTSKQIVTGKLRLDNPTATLSELSEISSSTDYPATKHTILSRLKKIHELALEKKIANNLE